MMNASETHFFRRTCCLIAPALIAVAPWASAEIVTSGLIQDLDADVGVVEAGGEGSGVTAWENQAAAGGDDVTTDRGTITLTSSDESINNHNFVTLPSGGPSPRMVGDDAEAFDGIMTGTGHTWFAVVRPEVDANPGRKNAIFGTLQNSNPFSGVVAHVSSNNSLGYMLRPANSDAFVDGTTSVNDGEWHILAGRLEAGTGGQLAEAFTNGPVAEASLSINILDSSISDALTVGAERTGGGENYLGDIARILIYNRPLDDEELNQTGFTLGELYGITNSFEGSSEPLRFLSIRFDHTTREVDVTWNSKPGSNYKFEISDNLQNWFEVTDNFPSQGETTTFTDESVTDTTLRRYYRVTELGN